MRRITRKSRATRSAKSSALGAFLALQIAFGIIVMQLKLMSGNHGRCRKCGAPLVECSNCYGGHNCTPCQNTGLICPVHGGFWQ